MTVLNRNEANALLAIICNNDPALCKIIKRLVELKIIGRLSTYYAQGDLNALSRTTVAGNVTMGTIIIPLTCDPNNPFNECNSG
jgi:hypothetical protein